VTATATPPPPSTPEDLPGVTRRHRFSDFYHETTNFQFIKHSRRWLIISGTMMLLAIVLLFTRGLNLGIEFKGGTEWQVKMENSKSASVSDVRDLVNRVNPSFTDAKVSVLGNGESVRVQARVLSDPTDSISDALSKYAKVSAAAVQFQSQGQGGSFTVTSKDGFTPTKEGVEAAIKNSGMTSPKVTVNGRDITVETAKMPPSEVQEVGAALAKYAGVQPNAVDIQRVGPTWGSEVSKKALQALVIFFLLLAVYLSIRFEWKMAASAIVAVIHDIIFTVGAYALFQFDVTPATVTAFLTILGFSLYDTVVVFDKVVEYQRTLTATGRSTYGEMVNRALNSVLMRSLSTSLVALLPVLSLLFIGAGLLGATALEDFALALAVGLFIGSYSSIFVAAPLLAWWKEKEPQYKALAERRRRTTMAAASVATGVPVVSYSDDIDRGTDADVQDEIVHDPTGVPGPPAVPRGPIQPRGRQQRGKKRK
jgi:preprotein translocase subunit SecF